jgi:hypothetical protein
MARIVKKKAKVKVKKKAAAKSKPKPKLKKAKKVVAKKSLAKKPAPKTKPAKPIGKVTHYYNSIKVAIVKFKINVRVGATLRFAGATTDFSQPVKSMQYDHKPITITPKGKLVGIKLSKRVREGDSVFLA